MASPRPQSLKGKSAVTSNSVTQMVNSAYGEMAQGDRHLSHCPAAASPARKSSPLENLPHLTPPYYLRPLNFSCLDDIGLKDQGRERGPPFPPQHSLCFFKATPHGDFVPPVHAPCSGSTELLTINTREVPHPLLPPDSLLYFSSVLPRTEFSVPPCSPFPSSFPEAIALRGSVKAHKSPYRRGAHLPFKNSSQPLITDLSPYHMTC